MVHEMYGREIWALKRHVVSQAIVAKDMTFITISVTDNMLEGFSPVYCMNITVWNHQAKRIKCKITSKTMVLQTTSCEGQRIQFFEDFIV